MLLPPATLVEVMESTPAISENCFSSGVATDDAMVCASVPASVALTLIVGRSTLGSSLTGRDEYPNRPAMRNAAISRVAITGRRMKTEEKFTAAAPKGSPFWLNVTVLQRC